MSSQERQNYHAKSEAGVNCLVNQFLHASDTYLLGYYFTRHDVALSKFAFFFRHLSEEKHEQAEKQLTFQNCCGGRVALQDVKNPEQDKWGNGTSAMASALQLEKSGNQALLELHQIASRRVDSHMCDFLETHYLNEEVKPIKQLGDPTTNLKRVCASEGGLGEYLFDASPWASPATELHSAGSLQSPLANLSSCVALVHHARVLKVSCSMKETYLCA